MSLKSLVLILVQVSLSQQLDRGLNLALKKPAYQSNTLLSGVASNAVDGYRHHPDFSENSCIETSLHFEPWWYVDLEDTFYVTSVIITNRKDCCHEQLTNFEVKIGTGLKEDGIRNPRCAPRFDRIINPGSSVEIICDEPLKGRYVTVVIPENAGILNFCELEVYGRKPSSVLHLKLVSYGFGETGYDRKPHSRLYENGFSYTFKSAGVNFKLYNVISGISPTYENFDVYGNATSSERLVNYLENIPNDTAVCMVLFLSGEKYYQQSVPLLENLLGQSITADLEHGETWTLLGYKGIHSPIPHWRQSVRKKSGDGPSVIASLVTLRKAPSGKATNINVVATSGSSLKLTWTRPADYLTDDDYPFDYKVCITNISHNFCDLAVKRLDYTFTGLQPLTNYSVSVQARSGNLSAESANISTSTIDQNAKLIKVKLISRLQEDAFYRVDGKPYSSIIVAGVAHNFEQHGHNFIILDALTGIVVQNASFNTNGEPQSGSNMAAFLSSLPNGVIILMVVYYRGQVYYHDAAASFVAVCPNVHTVLKEDQSNAVICLKGFGQTSWMDTKVSTYSMGPAVIEKDILLPKELLTFPVVLNLRAKSNEIEVHWSIPETDEFTGEIKRYEICYSGDFGTNDCDVVNGSTTRHYIINLHPYTEYQIKVRAASVLDYGPFSDSKRVSTLQAAPSGPPKNITVVHVNQSSIHLSWMLPARIHRNGIITGYSICLRNLTLGGSCLYSFSYTADQTSGRFVDLKPFTSYRIDLKAKTAWGYGPTANITQMTSTAAPSGPPLHIRLISINSTTFSISWSPPETDLRNGIIEKYKVCLRNNASFSPCEYEIFPGSKTNYSVSGLTPYTIYNVIVSAGTSAGFGPSSFVTNRTSESAPFGPPSSFNVTFVNSTYLQLLWKPPKAEHRNGPVIKYLLAIFPEDSSLMSKRTILLSGDNLSYLATDLVPFVKFICEIRAGTEVGFGPAAVTNVTTAMAAPSGPPTLVQVTNVTTTALEINWSPPVAGKRNGIIAFYLLCIREFGILSACNDTRNVSGSQLVYLFDDLKPNKEYLVEIKAATVIGYGPSTFVQKMAGKCDNPVVDNPKKIANFQFSASHYLGEGHEPFQARFTGLQTWCADGTKTEIYLQVDLGGSLRILAIGTQGDMRHYGSWVKLYNVSYKANEEKWSAVTVGGKKEIQGNNGEGVVKHYLDEPVTARYVRFNVLSFVGLHSCMRVEIFACGPTISPGSVSVESWNTTWIEISWEPPKVAETNGDIQGYVICAREISSTTCEKNATYVSSDDREYNITGLRPYTHYALEISCYNIAGKGPFVDVQQVTAEAAPSGFPETIDILETTIHSMKLYWSDVKEDQRNGIITKYALCYQEYELNHICKDFREIPVNPRNYPLSGLKPFTKYLILIKAATSAGWGPVGSRSHRTLSAPPSGPPTSVSIEQLGASILKVTWLPPEAEKRNGVIIGYRLCARHIGTVEPCHDFIVVSGNDRRHAIVGLKPYTMYVVSVEARTSAGYGPSSLFRHRTGESIPSGPPSDISVAFVNETSITVEWTSPKENEINGILTSYMVIIHEQPSNGNLKEISNETVSHSTLSWTFKKLKVKTEYIIEVRAGTVEGFGPPSVIHHKTSGEAEVTQVKKSNKAFVALAKAGIAAGALSILFVIGFFTFISLLVMGYVPYSSPWRKRRRSLWRQKVQQQRQERERRRSNDSEFGSSESGSNGESDYSDDGAHDGKKGTTGSKKKRRSRKKKAKKDPEKSDSESEVDDNGVEGNAMDIYGSCPEDIYGLRPENIYGEVRSNVHLAVENIYGGVPSNIHLAASGMIYGEAPSNVHPAVENIYGGVPSNVHLAVDNIYGGVPSNVHLVPFENNNRRVPSNVHLAVDNIYGGVPSNVHLVPFEDNNRRVPSNVHLPVDNIYGGVPSNVHLAVDNIYGGVPSNVHLVTFEDNNGGIPSNVHRTHSQNIYGGTMMDIYGAHPSNMYIARSVMDVYGSRPEDIYGGTQMDIYGSHPQFIYETHLNANGNFL